MDITKYNSFTNRELISHLELKVGEIECPLIKEAVQRFMTNHCDGDPVERPVLTSANKYPL